MWLKHGLDLKILTFRCQATGPKRGKQLSFPKAMIIIQKVGLLGYALP